PPTAPPPTRPSATPFPLTRGEGHLGHSPRESFSPLAWRRCREAADEGLLTCVISSAPSRSSRGRGGRRARRGAATRPARAAATPRRSTAPPPAARFFQRSTRQSTAFPRWSAA